MIVPTREEMSDMDAIMCNTLSETFHKYSSHTSYAGDDIDTNCDNSDSSSSNICIPKILRMYTKNPKLLRINDK